ncbi:MAG TPA: hypothetical protein VL172_08305 [Kofleriaceae bacterium]|nr:hypothetical protein [Kofleriaceae bacterium]
MRNDFGDFHGFLAYAFHSQLSLEQMLERLKAGSGQPWGRADKDRLGPYIVAGSFRTDYQIRLRIYVEDDQYVLDLMLATDEPQAEAEWAELIRYGRDVVLPLVEARDVSAKL